MKEDIYKIIAKEKLKNILGEFQLDFFGIHGFPHWARVIDNGLLLADEYALNKNILIIFALFHDIKRVRDEYDFEHGLRGGDFLLLNRKHINLTDTEINTAYLACKGHTEIKHSNDLNIAMCWDADRLDLMRVGLQPQSPYLNLLKSQQIDFIQERSIPANKHSIPHWGVNFLDDIGFKNS